MRDLPSVEEALEQMLEHVAAPGAERAEEIPLAQAAGRVSAADVRADRDLPAFPRSRVDGYAIRTQDVSEPGVVLPVEREIPAGVEPGGPLAPGSAARIFTGAGAPPDADAVVMQEHCDAVPADDDAGSRVRIGRVVEPGAYLVPVGSECRTGQTVVSVGDVLTPARIGAAASVGAARVRVFRNPTARVVSTGDELVPVESLPGPAQIRNSNAPALLATLREFGAEPLDARHAADDADAHEAAIAHALESDVCVVTGGVSVGDYDLVPATLERLGVRKVLHGVRVQPGKPLWFGTRAGTLVFGLPGNPVSALVIAALFVCPALRKLRGLPPVLPSRRARLLGPLPAGRWRRRYDPITLETGEDGRSAARPVPHRGSGDIFGFAHADALAVVPENAPAPVAGDDVEVVVLREPRLA